MNDNNYYFGKMLEMEELEINELELLINKLYGVSLK